LVQALIVADGDTPHRAALARLLSESPGEPLVIAADGGALKAESLGLRPQVVVGDSDSLTDAHAQRLRAQGAEVIVHPAAKDESDTELAVREALRRGAARVVIIGAFGGWRIEHTLANVLLLAMPELVGVDACLADARSTVRVLSGPGELTVNGGEGDYLSLLPLTVEARGVTTRGLLYPLSDAVLVQGPARGLSNELAARSATVSLDDGRLAVIHTIRSERTA
jgi:thiamine pyrophosphokinase